MHVASYIAIAHVHTPVLPPYTPARMCCNFKHLYKACLGCVYIYAQPDDVPVNPCTVNLRVYNVHCMAIVQPSLYTLVPLQIA